MRSHKAKKSCDKAGNDKEYADYPLISPFSRGIQKKTPPGGGFFFQKKPPPAAVFFSFN